MATLTKPLSYEKFKSYINDADINSANTLIEALNRRIKLGKIKIHAWHDKPEPATILSIVNEAFKSVGWKGIKQKRYFCTSRVGYVYSIELMVYEYKDMTE